MHPEPHSGENHLRAGQTILAVPDIHSGSTCPEEALPVNNTLNCRWTESQPSLLIEKEIDLLTRGDQVPIVQVRCEVPEERLPELLGLRLAGDCDELLPITLGVTTEELPGFVFFSISRRATLQYIFDGGFAASWLDSGVPFASASQ